MNFKALSFLGALSVLAGCGSAGVGVTPLTFSPSGGGFGLVEGTSGGNVFYAAVRDVEDATGLAAVSLSDISAGTVDANGMTRGTVTVQYASGTEVDVPAIFYQDIAGIYGRFDDQTSLAIVVGGQAASNLPLGNDFTYTGVSLMSFDTATSASTVTQEGTFSMTANLIDNRGSLSASTADASYTNNSIVFETDGTFAGKTGTFTVPADSSSRGMPLYGSLNGEGGAYVSGAGVSGSHSADSFSYVAILGKRQ